MLINDNTPAVLSYRVFKKKKNRPHSPKKQATPILLLYPLSYGHCVDVRHCPPLLLRVDLVDR